MILLFIDGPIAGLQLEQDHAPIKFTGAVTTMMPGNFEDGMGVIREYDTVEDSVHKQFCYRQEYYVMNAAGKLKAITYRWVCRGP